VTPVASEVEVGTRVRDTAAGRARIAAAIARLRGGSMVTRTADGRQGLKDFEIARLRHWCLETETPWGPRWTDEPVLDEPVEHEA
jgi:hypothetical protein